MSRQHHRKHRSKIRSLHIWHRYIGLTAALLVTILATTGVLLNHTQHFLWDRDYVSAPWLLDWYGIAAPREIRSFRAGDQTLSLYGQRLYLDDRRLEGEYQQLHGALAIPELLVVAVDQSLLLLSHAGERIDHLDENAGLPGAVQRMGQDTQGRPLLMIDHQLYQPDVDWLRWELRTGNTGEIRWSGEIHTDSALQERLAVRFRSQVLPVERVLLDLHSGRIFGRYGIWVMDGAAGLLLLLAGSGIWMWYKRRR